MYHTTSMKISNFIALDKRIVYPVYNVFFSFEPYVVGTYSKHLISTKTNGFNVENNNLRT